MRNVLVTGGAGFVGSHVVDHFLNAGADVTVLDDLSSGRRENVDPRATLCVADIGSPEASALVADGGFDLVAHLAAQVDVRKSVSDPRLDAQTNIMGALNLLEAVRRLPAARRPRLVFASTGGALYGGSAPLPTAEHSFPAPEAPYGVAKLTVEFYLAYYASVWAVNSLVLRFGNVYGPRQDPAGEAGVIAIFAQRIAKGQPLTIFGDGRQTRDYVYVEDIARAFLATACCEPRVGGVCERAVNIGTGNSTSVIELAHLLGDVAGREPIIDFAPPRPGEVRDSQLDVRKAADVLGWCPRVSLRDGLAETYEWVMSREHVTPAPILNLPTRSAIADLPGIVPDPKTFGRFLDSASG